MKYFLFSILAVTIMLASCREKTKKAVSIENDMSIYLETDHPSYVSNLEFAHEKSNLFQNEMVCFNLDMRFGTQQSLMKIFTTPNSSAIRVDKLDGTSTIMLNGKVYTNAEQSQWDAVKSSLYTYQYFFMTPYKLSDKGTKWEKQPQMDINGISTNRAKMTFEAGTGDSPDDWYMVHSDPTSNLIKHMGYIVTGGGTTIEEAEQNAHAISYLDYKQIDGIPMATKWIFSDYDVETGLGEQIGEGTLRNIDFMDVLDQFSVALTEEYHLIK